MNSVEDIQVKLRVGGSKTIQGSIELNTVRYSERPRGDEGRKAVFHWRIQTFLIGGGGGGVQTLV